MGCLGVDAQFDHGRAGLHDRPIAQVFPVVLETRGGKRIHHVEIARKQILVGFGTPAVHAELHPIVNGRPGPLVVGVFHQREGMLRHPRFQHVWAGTDRLLRIVFRRFLLQCHRGQGAKRRVGKPHHKIRQRIFQLDGERGGVFHLQPPQRGDRFRIVVVAHNGAEQVGVGVLFSHHFIPGVHEAGGGHGGPVRKHQVGPQCDPVQGGFYLFDLLR